MAFTVQGVRVWTLAEAAEHFGVSETTMYTSWIPMGFPVFRVKNIVLVLEPKAKAWGRRVLERGRIPYGARLAGR